MVHLHWYGDGIALRLGAQQEYIMTLAEQLEHDEARRHVPYQDNNPSKLWTVGIGRMIDVRNNGGLSGDEIQRLLQNPARKTYPESERYAYQQCPNFWNVPLSDDEIDYLLQNDINHSRRDCRALFINFTTIQPEKQDALTNMMFNLGYSTFSLFHHTIDDVDARNWPKVCDDLKNSKWYKQVGHRADRIIAVLGA